MPIHNAMPGVEITTAKTVEKDGWNATHLNLYSHSGTHMDAPVHFNVGTLSIDQLDPQRLISKAWVVDVTAIGPKGLITPFHLEGLSEKFIAGDSLLLHTDWSEKVGTKAYRDELPRISEELAHWMVRKKVNILGVEPPSVADVNNLDEVTNIHSILMQNDIIILEGLTNLGAISQEFVTLIALPLKVKNGDGAPARVIAMET
ncbi:cyclase family protein [uncultured Croceitalea sp.]|uniref:cyclase family protein n=1 Tax=uncultured Croceitalea sp. TaxID=1798908 RepID=UPI00374EE237